MTAIFDRTQADVDYARDNPHSEIPLKGARNHTDLARISGNIHRLCEVLTLRGYPISATCKTVWNRNALEPHSEIHKIFADIERIRAVFPALPDSPDTPPLPWNHFQKLNDAERIIYDLNVRLSSLTAAFYPAGTLKSGRRGTLPRTI